MLDSDFVRAGAPQGSLGRRSGPESEQSAIALRDRLARQLTVVTSASVPILDARPRQYYVGCLTRAASSIRYDSQERTGWSLVFNHERRSSACRLIHTTRWDQSRRGPLDESTAHSERTYLEIRGQRDRAEAQRQLCPKRELPLANGHGQQTTVIQGAVILVRHRYNGNKSFSGSSKITSGSQHWPEPHAAVPHQVLSVSIIVNQFMNMDILYYVMIRAVAGLALLKPARPLLSIQWRLDRTHC